MAKTNTKESAGTIDKDQLIAQLTSKVSELESQAAKNPASPIIEVNGVQYKVLSGANINSIDYSRNQIAEDIDLAKMLLDIEGQRIVVPVIEEE